MCIRDRGSSLWTALACGAITALRIRVAAPQPAMIPLVATTGSDMHPATWTYLADLYWLTATFRSCCGTCSR
eukprot:12469052-Alexandrium_andersonii.AAC.1